MTFPCHTGDGKSLHYGLDRPAFVRRTM